MPTSLQVIGAALGLVGYVRILVGSPRTVTGWCTDGDSDRVREFADVEPYRDGEILPVIKGER